MKQRQQDSYGFADPRRTAPSWMLDQMIRNIPRQEWDVPRTLAIPNEPTEFAPGMYTQDYTAIDPMTLRQLMEFIKKLDTTQEQQGP